MTHGNSWQRFIFKNRAEQTGNVANDGIAYYHQEIYILMRYYHLSSYVTKYTFHNKVMQAFNNAVNLVLLLVIFLLPEFEIVFFAKLCRI